LTAQQHLIFLLKHREGMTYEEIARACSISTGTVKKALFRAVSRLREYMGIKSGAADDVSLAARERR
jgi:RNA polymerase sigma factor (sigma-70 family)